MTQRRSRKQCADDKSDDFPSSYIQSPDARVRPFGKRLIGSWRMEAIAAHKRAVRARGHYLRGTKAELHSNNFEVLATVRTETKIIFTWNHGDLQSTDGLSLCKKQEEGPLSSRLSCDCAIAAPPPISNKTAVEYRKLVFMGDLLSGWVSRPTWFEQSCWMLFVPEMQAANQPYRSRTWCEEP